MTHPRGANVPTTGVRTSRPTAEALRSLFTQECACPSSRTHALDVGSGRQCLSSSAEQPAYVAAAGAFALGVAGAPAVGTDAITSATCWPHPSHVVIWHVLH